MRMGAWSELSLGRTSTLANGKLQCQYALHKALSRRAPLKEAVDWPLVQVNLGPMNPKSISP